jgi:hypothetical protein
MGEVTATHCQSGGRLKLESAYLEGGRIFCANGKWQEQGRLVATKRSKMHAGDLEHVPRAFPVRLTRARSVTL